ncbi:MAG TPA: 50S ribosomal protein L6 [Bacteroidetes bacterium]|nr:50S ribosomal protein L6 [Bacteroidota bacterium]
MSRIGKSPINLPQGVTLEVSKGNLVTVKGPKGTLTQQVDPDISVKVEDGVVTLERPTESIRHRSFHGLYRSLLNNMVEGVTNGFVKELELVGVGFRASNTGNLLEMQLGFSHPIYFYIPDDLQLETITEKGKNPLIKISGIDKQLVGQVAAKIKSFRKPEPYKGKGVRYKGEEIRRKVGKTAGA